MSSRGSTRRADSLQTVQRDGRHKPTNCRPRDHSTGQNRSRQRRPNMRDRFRMWFTENAR